MIIYFSQLNMLVMTELLSSGIPAVSVPVRVLYYFVINTIKQLLFF